MTMQTWLRRTRTPDTQRRAPFTGEGAYHGASRPQTAPPPAPPPPPVAEVRPRTLEADESAGRTEIAAFTAHFPPAAGEVARLPVPTDAEVAADAVTFVWCPLETALQEAGPLTRRVLEAMQPHLTGTRRHTYIDSKLQWFEPGDLPVDSQLWHVDGSIVVRGPRAEKRGAALLHDMKARLDDDAPPPPLYLAYLSSDCSATQLAAAPVAVPLPALIPSFDGLDAQVRRADPPIFSQAAGSIVAFDGRSLHRARPATRAGWRLWIRCVETDREVRLSHEIIECYNTVFRPVIGDLPGGTA